MEYPEHLITILQTIIQNFPDVVQTEIVRTQFPKFPSLEIIKTNGIRYTLRINQEK
jgi:hypothetical protein